MQYFHYKNNQLFAEQVNVNDIADQFGTPCYVYSRASLEDNWRAFNKGFGHTAHRICYAVKANSNIAVLNVLARLDSGFDIVSQGELERVLAAGGNPSKIVFSGVGKKSDEIIRALEVGIHCFNVESEVELERLNTLAKQQNKIAPIALRINPNIDAGTHHYISTGLKENKFGIDASRTIDICRNIQKMSHLNLIGIACHIGSQLTDLSPFQESTELVVDLINQLKQEGIKLQHINVGGGLGVQYQNESPPSITDYVAIICEKLKNLSLEIIIEPGRAITANAGILVTRVEYLKHTEHKNFAIVDAAMNDLMRPALYDAWQNIIPVIANDANKKTIYDIVGPVCESADFLGKDRLLNVSPNDLLAVCSAGAYGFSMSSNYNSRPRVAEVMVDKDKVHLIRQRETIEGLFSNEKLIL